MTPIIAIVGAVNTGKSTLFNRLTKSRNALVADRPGVTRDRQYGICEVDGQSLAVIDTGGLMPTEDEESPFVKLVTSQIDSAIAEADLILWLVDARAGLSASDELITDRIRAANKKVLLCANKCEHLDPDIACAEFFRLGAGVPLPISSLTGSGVDELLAQVIAGLNLQALPGIDQPDSGLRIAIVGRPNVGKSTLINRMLGEERMLTLDRPGTTRDSIMIQFQRRGKHYVLVDTAGIRRRARVRDTLEKFSIVKSLQAIEESDVSLLVVDAQNGLTEQDLNLLGIIAGSGKSLIIAVNKWDGLSAENRIRIRAQIDRKLRFVEYAPIHTISALHGTGVGHLFDAIDQVGRTQSRVFSSRELTELLHAAMDAHPPPLIQGRRIKLRYAHIGGHNPLRIVIHGNQTRHVTDTYKRYLANFFRKQMALIATPVLIEFKHSANPFSRRGQPRAGRFRGKGNPRRGTRNR